MSTLKPTLSFTPQYLPLDDKHMIVAIQGPLAWSAIDLHGPDHQSVSHETLFELCDSLVGTVTECAEEALSELLSFARDLDYASQVATAAEVSAMLGTMAAEGMFDDVGMTSETADELAAQYEQERHQMEAEHLAQEAMRPRKRAHAGRVSDLLARSGGLR